MISDFSTVLVSLRKARGISQKQAAKDLHISQALLSHYENGVREPKFDFVDKVCLYYGVTADFMLGRSGETSVTINCPSKEAVNAAEKMSDMMQYLESTANEELLSAASSYLSAMIDDVVRAIENTPPDSRTAVKNAALYEKIRASAAKEDTAQVNEILALCDTQGGTRT